MGEAANGAKGHYIIHPINKANATLDLGNFMIVIPDFVGSDALFIDERLPLMDMFVLSQPSLFTEEGYAHPVFNKQPVIHDVRNIADDLETQVGRGNHVQIGR